MRVRGRGKTGIPRKLPELGKRLSSPPKLTELGNRLLSLPWLRDDQLLRLLHQTNEFLSKVGQPASIWMRSWLCPNMKIMVTNKFLRHPIIDVKVAVAACLTQLTRIIAPDYPYDDEIMKEIFRVIVEAFKNLDDILSPSFAKRVSILETVAKSKLCLLMLDLKCDDLILDMSRYFFAAIRPYHAANIFNYMETIMSTVLKGSEDISQDLVSCLLESVKIVDGISTSAKVLGERVIRNSAKKLKPYFLKLPTQSISLYCQVVASLCRRTSIAIAQNEDNVSEEPDAIPDTKSKEDAPIIQSKKDADHCLDVSNLGKEDSSSKDDQHSSVEGCEMSTVSSPARLGDPDIAGPKPITPAKFSNLHTLASVCEDFPSASEDSSGKEDEHVPSKDSDSKKKADDFSDSETMPLKLSNRKSQPEDTVRTPETGHIDVKSPRRTTERGSSASKVTRAKSLQKQSNSKVKQQDKLKANKEISVQVVAKKTVSSTNYANKSQVEDNLEDGPNTSSKRKRVHYEEFQLDEDNTNQKQQDDGHKKEVAGKFQLDKHNAYQKQQDDGHEKEVAVTSQRLDGIADLQVDDEKEFVQDEDNRDHKHQGDGPATDVGSICQRLHGIVALIHQMQIAQEAHRCVEQWQNHVNVNFETIASNQQELLSRIVGRAPPLPTPSFFNTSRQPRPLYGPEKEVASIYQCLDSIVVLIHQMQIGQQEAQHHFEQWQNHVDANFQTIASNQQELLSRIIGMAPPLPTPTFFSTSLQPKPLHEPEKEVSSIYQCLDGIMVLIHQMQIEQEEAHHRFEQWQNHVDANFQTIASNQQELWSRIVGRAPPLPTPSFFNTSHQPRLDESP